MLFQMAYLVFQVKIFRQRPYVKLDGDLVDALPKKFGCKTFVVDPFLQSATKVYHETSSTEPVWQFPSIGSVRNHSYGAFILCTR